MSNTTYIPVLGSYGPPRPTIVSDVRVGDIVLGVSDNMIPQFTRVLYNYHTSSDDHGGFDFITIATKNRNMTVTTEHVVVRRVNGVDVTALAGDIIVGDTIIGVNEDDDDCVKITKELRVEAIEYSQRNDRFTIVTETGTVVIGDYVSPNRMSLAVTTICTNSTKRDAPIGEVLEWWRVGHKWRFSNT